MRGRCTHLVNTVDMNKQKTWRGWKRDGRTIFESLHLNQQSAADWRSPSTPAHVPVTNLLFHISEPRRYSLLSVFVDCVSSIYAHIRFKYTGSSLNALNNKSLLLQFINRSTSRPSVNKEHKRSSCFQGGVKHTCIFNELNILSALLRLPHAKVSKFSWKVGNQDCNCLWRLWCDGTFKSKLAFLLFKKSKSSQL